MLHFKKFQDSKLFTVHMPMLKGDRFDIHMPRFPAFQQDIQRAAFLKRQDESFRFNRYKLFEKYWFVDIFLYIVHNHASNCDQSSTFCGCCRREGDRNTKPISPADKSLTVKSGPTTSPRVSLLQICPVAGVHWSIT